MADNNLAEIYDAIRAADAAGDTESVQKLQAYLNTMPKETEEVATAPGQRSAFVPGGVGALAGMLGGGKMLESEVKARFPYDVSTQKPSATATPAPPKQFQTPTQVAERMVKAAPVENWGRAMNKAAEYYGGEHMSDEYKRMLAAKTLEESNKGYKGLPAGDKTLLIPEETAAQVKAERAAAQQAKINEAAQLRAQRMLEVDKLRAEKAAQEAARKASFGNKVKALIPTIEGVGHTMHRATSPFAANLATRGLTGFGAGYGGYDALQRAQRGEYGRAVVSGLGAIGDVASMSRHPIAMPVGTAAGIAAPLTNMYLDQLAEEGRLPKGFDKGGVVNLAEMGEARAYEPSYSEKIRDFAAKHMGREQANRLFAGPNARPEDVFNPVSMALQTPGAIADAAKGFYEAGKKGDYLDAMGNYLVGAMNVAPMIKPGAQAVKTAAKELGPCHLVRMIRLDHLLFYQRRLSLLKSCHALVRE